MTVTAPQRPPRGRPRPAETIERDRKILALLKSNPDGMARNVIAEEMGLNKSRTYLSLDRLRRQGLAAMVKSEESQADKDALWVAVQED
jgi:predicted ArsR family transcriptional regulator